MAFGFDPGIILSARFPKADTTLSDLADAGQRRQVQAQTLADLVRKRQQGQRLADLLQQNAGSFADPTASMLAAGRFPEEALEQQQRARPAGAGGFNIIPLADGTYAFANPRDPTAPAQPIRMPDGSAAKRPMPAPKVPPNPVDVDLNRRKKEAQIKAAEAKLSPENIAATQTKAGNDATDKLRAQFDRLPEVKAFDQVVGYFDNLKAAKKINDDLIAQGKPPSGAGDLTYIFNFMKTMDPGVAVMEGDIANARNTGSVPEKIWSTYNKALNGEQLTPEMRADFYRQAEAIFRNKERRRAQAAKRYRGFAKDRKLRPDDVAAFSGKVRVSNGKETLEIDGADLSHAEDDGYSLVFQ